MCVFGGNLNALTASLCMFKQNAILELKAFCSSPYDVYKELSELSTIDVKGKVTDEEFKVSREGLLLLRRRQSLIGENVPLFFYVEVVCNRDVADEARRGGGSEDGEGNGLGVEAGLEMEKGRDLGLKVERARDEAEASHGGGRQEIGLTALREDCVESYWAGRLVFLSTHKGLKHIDKPASIHCQGKETVCFNLWDMCSLLLALFDEVARGEES
ncbi:hypothetical protein F2Q70_00005007 [Brassica cretica]|uniref:Uncharacterized protein n=1 Tax=Brassica cretica TaxID=69181 RepID=A0A8S9IT93_BRACR|nr:hypothetical protein F2Q70_00005007 [Brassica cretica]